MSWWNEVDVKAHVWSQRVCGGLEDCAVSGILSVHFMTRDTFNLSLLLWLLEGVFRMDRKGQRQADTPPLRRSVYSRA